MPTSPDTQLAELMESVRKQDDRLHSWTTTLVTVEGGIVAALGLLWSAAPAVAGITLKAAATIALAFIAIAACWTCVRAAISELEWQGRYVAYVKAVEPFLFADVNPTPDKWGLQARLYAFLGAAISAFWVLAMVAAVVKWCRS